MVGRDAVNTNCGCRVFGHATHHLDAAGSGDHLWNLSARFLFSFEPRCWQARKSMRCRGELVLITPVVLMDPRDRDCRSSGFQTLTRLHSTVYRRLPKLKRSGALDKRSCPCNLLRLIGRLTHFLTDDRWNVSRFSRLWSAIIASWNGWPVHRIEFCHLI